MDSNITERIPGAAELIQWFGKFPHFHDANVEELHVRGDGSGTLRIKSWRMTDRVDEKGYFVLEKHFVATFQLMGISHVELSEFQPGQAILFSLEINESDTGFELVLESSYGVSGSIRLQALQLTFEPAIS